MPVENFEEEGLEKIPNLTLAQWVFQTSLPDSNIKELKEKIMNAIQSDNMSHYYQHVCKELNWGLNDKLFDEMKAANDIKLKELDEKIKDCEENLGDTEVREAMMEKAHYYSRIGDKENALSQFRLIGEKTLMLGYRIDMTFHLIRIGFFYNDRHLIVSNIDKANDLIEEGGDWDRRNRLKVYRGLYNLSIRDFETAANHFLDGVATFTSYELMDYKTFIVYSVLCAMISLKRPDLKEKVIRGSEIQEVLHSMEGIRLFLNSLFECHYGDFFRYLSGIEQYMLHDRYLSLHTRYYVREMRILAYAQQLESYRSLTLKNMAEAFGVTVDYIDRELSRFIAAGRLSCKIDKVGGIVETTRPDNINFQYQSTIRHGDVLLNRIQKLSRVINI